MQELTRTLDPKACRYVAGPASMGMPELRHGAIRVPANADPAANGMVALPVRAHGVLQGHLVLVFPLDTFGATLTSEQRHAAVALADQVGIGLLQLRRLEPYRWAVSDAATARAIGVGGRESERSARSSA